MHKFGRSVFTLALLGAAVVAGRAQSMMTHNVRDVVRNGQAQSNGRLSQNQMMNLDIVLPVRDQAGLDRFVAEVYDAASANYRHFLTPQEFTARFGPTQVDYDAVVQFAQIRLHGNGRQPRWNGCASARKCCGRGGCVPRQDANL